jgi:hypothetical protein
MLPFFYLVVIPLAKD